MKLRNVDRRIYGSQIEERSVGKLQRGLTNFSVPKSYSFWGSVATQYMRVSLTLLEDAASPYIMVEK